jgi:hypothetical protein
MESVFEFRALYLLSRCFITWVKIFRHQAFVIIFLSAGIWTQGLTLTTFPALQMPNSLWEWFSISFE